MKLKCDLDNLTSVVFISFTNVYSKEIGIDKQQQQQKKNSSCSKGNKREFILSQKWMTMARDSGCPQYLNFL